MPRENVESALEHAHELVVGKMNDHVVPGLGLGVIHGGETVCAGGFGLADLAREKPVTPRTVFRIGSIGKTMTAMGLMRLWERGGFRLDDPVNEYLRSYRIEQRDTAAPPVTFRHLLTHTSGLGGLRGPTDLFRPVLGLGVKPHRPVPELVEYYAGGLRPKVYPGTRWAYSNHAFATLGQLVEDLSGQPFAEYMKENVFEPLGMSSTGYLLSEDARDRLAEGYALARGGLEPVEYLEIVVKGAGSVFSNVEDMNRYVRALLGGGANRHGRVLGAETLALMMEPHYRLSERLPAMGLAFLLYRLNGHEIAGHDGGWPGFVSSMLLCPEEELGIVVLANSSSHVAHEVSEGLIGRMLDVPEPASSLPKKGILESPRLWPQLRGFYGPERILTAPSHVWPAYAGEIEVLATKNHLTMRALTGPLRKGARLYPVDAAEPLAFEVRIEGHPQPVVFGRDPASDRIDRLCIGFDRLRKRPRARSLRFGIRAGLGVAAGVALGVAARRKPKTS